MTTPEDEKAMAMPDAVYLYMAKDGVIEQMPATASPVHKDWTLYSKALAPAPVAGDLGESVKWASDTLEVLKRQRKYRGYSGGAKKQIDEKIKHLETLIQAATSQQARQESPICPHCKTSYLHCDCDWKRYNNARKKEE